MEFDFKTIFRQLGFGDPTAQPQRVTGGYLHKMFQVETPSGKYAVKLLNPLIMKRPGVLESYRRADRIEQILSKNNIPIIPALVFGGSSLQCRSGQYFYIFEWTDAKALNRDEIREEHCRIIGRLLARIHKIPLKEACSTPSGAHPKEAGTNSDSHREAYISTRKFHTDWDSYIRLAEKMHSELAGELAAHRSLLYQAQQEYNAAIDSLPNRICISDGDMDCKNVLWKNGEPFISDLECLDYGNPFPEMLQLALSWAGGDVCSIDPGRLHTFLTAYRAEYGEIPVDWKMLSGAGYSWLDWLEYNTKRALRIECGDEEEQRLGLREAQETIRRIDYYQHVREKIFSTG